MMLLHALQILCNSRFTHIEVYDDQVIITNDKVGLGQLADITQLGRSSEVVIPTTQPYAMNTRTTWWFLTWEEYTELLRRAGVGLVVRRHDG